MGAYKILFLQSVRNACQITAATNIERCASVAHRTALLSIAHLLVVGSSLLSVWKWGNPFSKFWDVILPKHDFKQNLKQILDSAARRGESMKEKLTKVRNVFLWRGHGAHAYNVTIHELCLRARRRRGTVDCSMLLPAEARHLIIPSRWRKLSQKYEENVRIN